MTGNAETRSQALRFLSRRPHSRAQLQRKLARRHSRESIQEVLDDLEELGLLDDVAVARERARYGRERRRWGDSRIRADLRNLGIDAKIVDSVLLEINQQGSEQEPLDAVIDSWTAKRGRPETAAQIKKLFDHCLRRGFSAQRVRETLKPFWSGAEWQ